MSYLLDTNVLLEILLDQQQADQCEKLLTRAAKNNLFISEFSLYSIGIILFRHDREAVFLQLVDDLVLSGRANILSLTPPDFQELVSFSEQYGLDFDDAYQYTLAETHDLELISFDQDFDKTPKGRKEPSEVLSQE